MDNESLNDIYRVESISQRETEIVNKLLENDWKLLSIEQRGDLSIDGIPESFVYMLLGATKDVSEKYSLDDATPKSQYDDLF